MTDPGKRIEQLERKLQAKTEEAVNAANLRDEARARARELEDQLREVTAELDALKTELDALKTQLETMTKELEPAEV